MTSDNWKRWEGRVNAIAEYPAPEIFTLKTVCDYLQISRATVYRMIRLGHLRTIRIGKAHRVTSLELDRLMAEQGIYASQRKKT